MSINQPQKNIGVLGAGRQAAETADYLLDMGHKVDFFFCEHKYTETNSPLAKLAPIITENSNLAEFANIYVISAVGSPKIRKHLVSLWPHNNFFSLVHPSAIVSNNAKIGKDVTVPPMCVINTDVTIGDHVLLNLASTVSHDAKLGEYVTISPGVSISGVVSIGQGTLLGVGASIIDHVSIGEGVVVAAGSTVVNNVRDNCMVAGVPAVEKKQLTEWY